MAVERECKIRKMLAPFQKPLEDFTGVHEYNDYLEDIENEVLDLMKMTDKEINQIVEKYKKERIITVKKIKLAEEPEVKIEVEYDPLEDVDLSYVKLTKKHKIPVCIKVNHLYGGFSENIMVYKCLNSLYDDFV